MTRMTNALLFLAVTTSVAWALTPRVFWLCDVVVTHQRLREENGAAKKTRVALGNEKSKRITTDFLTARNFNELARLTRAHVSMRDAMQSITSDESSKEWRLFLQLLEQRGSFDEACHDFSSANHPSLALQLLRASISNGNFVPAALDQAALLIRDTQRTKGDIAIATAQAHLTMRMLTSAPFVLLAFALVVSESFRRVITSPGVVAVCIVALLLNRAGVKWMTFLVRRLDRPTPVDEVLHLVTVLAVHVRAGHSLPSACQHLLGISALGDAIASSVQRGDSFDTSLSPLRNHSDQFGADIATILVTAYRDGQPALETIGAITNEARLQRDQQTQVQIRQLPTQLTAPVVLCALPSFILLVVVPLMIAQFSTLSGSFSAIPS